MPLEEAGVAVIAETSLTEAILAEWEWFDLLRIRCEPLSLIGHVRVHQVSEFNGEFEHGR